MASISRQPFAPLDGARLQSLTSWKNRQNALTPEPNNTKRKAEMLDLDRDHDLENVDPCLTAKRSKGALASPAKDLAGKKTSMSAYVLTRAAATTPAASPQAFKASTAPRRTLRPKSPNYKFRTGAAKSSPLSAPAGRSPARGTRSGLLSNHRQSTGGPYTRVDPPTFALDAAASFSLNAALKGTISSYSTLPRSNAPSIASGSISSSLGELDTMASWFFDIHEDTPEQEMTNLLQHGTCVLDLSSDEENEQKARRDKAEGRDKENVPPSGHVPQTSTRRPIRAASHHDMVVEKERVVLGEMKTADLVADGGRATSVVLIPGDDDAEDDDEGLTAHPDQFAPEPSHEDGPGVMHQVLAASETSEPGAGEAVLEPIEGTGESFDLWESGSVKDESGLAATES
ncbi:hypothetical protein E4U42_001493 [Claviceps africana]|uniref:Thymidylate kinase n=1 Tax=Claviceps africana TaxID=83212 RepID=A0A8K0NJ68_9HYPO|nr:hypothetical protein E4U42_001493 [Claviceps africana]